MQFVKMHGAGNDYVYVDCFAQPVPAQPAKLAPAISDRHTGVGADGLILITPSERADAWMLMWNADGSRGEMCGNGVRCVAKYLYESGIARKSKLRVETDRGVLDLELEVAAGRVNRVRVNMGRPVFKSSEIPTTLPGDPPIGVRLELAGVAESAAERLEVTCLSMGNPHCVVFADELSDGCVRGFGPRIEHHPGFPNRVNVEFAKVLSRSEMRVRVWERGAGETLACGTGACAAVVAGRLIGVVDSAVLVHLPGGPLNVEVADAGEVFLTGPAEEVFRGEWPERADCG
jgi:diaminopimelate epimerase